MKFIKIVPIALFFLTSQLLVAQNRSIQFEHGSWQEVLEKAKTEKKIIFVDAYASWCGPCKWMAANTFTNDAVADFFNATFVNAKIDMEKGEGPELQKSFKVGAFPTLLFIDPNTGKTVHRAVGGMDPQNILKVAAVANNPEARISWFEGQYAAGKLDKKGMLNYIVMLTDAMMPADAVVDQYFKGLQPSEIATKDNWDFLSKANKIDSKSFQLIVKNKQAFAKVIGNDALDKHMMACYRYGATPFIRRADDKGLDEYKAKVKASGFAKSEQLFLTFDLDKYMSKKDWVGFGKTADKIAADKSIQDANLFNSMAWTYFENVTESAQLEKASAWAQRSIAIEKSSMNTDTYANILFKLGKKEQAIAAEQEALELAKKEGTPIESYQKTLDEMKAKN